MENPRYPYSNGKEEIARRGLGLSGNRRHGRSVLVDEANEKLRIGGRVPSELGLVEVEPRDAVLRAAGPELGRSARRGSKRGLSLQGQSMRG
nr:unnamed protein product [Digitaria exilis]